jgi:hypothetical protein
MFMHRQVQTTPRPIPVPASIRLAGGIPGQPEPDTPGEPVLPDQPTEPGEPTVPDQAPPIPTATAAMH